MLFLNEYIEIFVFVSMLLLFCTFVPVSVGVHVDFQWMEKSDGKGKGHLFKIRMEVVRMSETKINFILTAMPKRRDKE